MAGAETEVGPPPGTRDAARWLVETTGDPADELADRVREVRGRVRARYASRGEGYLGRVEEAEVLEGNERVPGVAGVVVLPVRGSRRSPYAVSVRLSDDGSLSPRCTCPAFPKWGPCKHLWAALCHLEAALEESTAPAGAVDLPDPGSDTEDAPPEEAHEEDENGSPVPDATAGLDRLDRFLEAARDPWAAAARVEEERERRIAWRLRIREGDGIRIRPVEQKVSKRGGWTRGRRIGLRYLRKHARRTPRPDVRRVLALLERRLPDRPGYWSRDLSRQLRHAGVEETGPLLAALVDNPHVHREGSPSEPVEVRRAHPEVDLTRLPDDRLLLRPVLEGRPATLSEGAGKLLWAADDETGPLLVADLDPTTSALCAGLTEDLGPVDPEATTALLRRLPAIEHHLPVRVPPDLRGPEVEAAPAPLVRVRPVEAGVRLALRVRPVPEGPVREPGAGPGRVSEVVDDVLRSVVRDLEAETARARELARTLELPGPPAERSWTWTLSGDEALDALDGLDDLAVEADDPDELDDPTPPIVEWGDGTPRPTGSVSPGDLRVTVRQRGDWFGIGGEVEVDGHRIAFLDLLEAIRAGHRWVAVDGDRWVRISRDLRHRLGLIDDAGHRRGGETRVGAPAVEVVDEALADAGNLDLDAAWLDLRRRVRDAREVSTDPPDELEAELRPYQRRGYAWMTRLAARGVGCILADDMGLGKTVQAIAVLCDRTVDGPALVVCPTSVGFGWMREVERFAPSLEARRYRETDREGPLETGPGEVIVCSWDLARIDADRLADVEWTTLVLDEAQRVKNARTKTHRALRDLEAGWTVALTGTPVENHLGELWSIFRLVEPGLLGPWSSFEERFAAPIEREGSDERRAALARVIRPFCLRRTKEEVLDDLPPRTEVCVDVELSPEERARYDAVRLAALSRLTGDEGEGDGPGRMEILAALTRLRQLACHPRLVDGDWPGSSAKVETLLALLEPLVTDGHRALVFSQFTSFLDIVEDVLARRGRTILRLDGSTPARERERLVDAFQAGEAEIFLISLRAGGQGLNLTGADQVFHLDPWWNPAVEDQATDRAHRIGQERPVTVHRLVAADTIEERIVELHETKRDLVEGVLAGTDRAGRLSTDELLALLRDASRTTPPGGEADPPPGLPAPLDGPPALDEPAANGEPGPTDASGKSDEATGSDDPDPPPMGPAAIRSLRDRLGLTQRALGEKVGVTGPTVCNWEKGRHGPSDRALRALRALEAADPNAS